VGGWGGGGGRGTVAGTCHIGGGVGWVVGCGCWCTVWGWR